MIFSTLLTFCHHFRIKQIRVGGVGYGVNNISTRSRLYNDVCDDIVETYSE